MTERTALVTGASRGIGLGIARRLAEKGYGLTITARDPERLEALAAELRGAGAAEVVVQAGDATDPDLPAALVDRHCATFSSMSALILNAGMGIAGDLATFPLPRFDLTMTVNLRTPFAILQASLPALRAAAVERPSTGARVVALASIAGVHAEPQLAAYGASKAALLSLIDALNAEESGNGILGTAIAPGFVETDMSTWVLDRIAADDMIPVDDIVRVVEALLELSSRSVISQVVVGRAGSRGYVA